ncbi:MAG: cyclic beta 1-2 glucan synthetase, partial [Methylococcaceae bacterium]
SGSLSDVQLYEEYPTRYSSDVSRRHRWIRGDWQLLGWLLPSVPSPLWQRGAGGIFQNHGPWSGPEIPPNPPFSKGGTKPAPPLEGGKTQWVKNPLSALSRWKIFDNLRRSLTPVGLTLLLLLGWTLLASAGFFTLAVLGILLIPPLSAAVLDVLRKPAEVLLRQHGAEVLRATGGHLAQAAFNLACLPYEAYFSLDAILRTLWRMAVTKKGLLQWSPSSEDERHDHATILGACRAMGIAPAIAIATALLLALTRPAVLSVAGPILLLWLASPAIAWWLSRPLALKPARLTLEQTRFLRKIARRTWAFFDAFVGPRDHWLPPDNYQEYRAVGLAHRTSPTNMGLALLANLSAYDFGYIPAGVLLERSAHTLGTMEDLKRYHGHFFNWYDTQSLQPLHPVYVSTVDSGNLAGHLLTLRPGLLALPDQPILGPQWWQGLHDTLAVLLEATGGVTPLQLVPFQQALEAVCVFQQAATAHPPLWQRGAGGISQNHCPRQAQEIPPNPPFSKGGTGMELAEVHSCLNRLATLASAFADTHSAVPSSEVSEWAHALARQCRAGLDELLFLVPWLILPPTPRGLSDIPLPLEMPTLRELARQASALLPLTGHRLDKCTIATERDWLTQLQRHVTNAHRRAQERMADCNRLAQQLSQLAQMEYGFLYDPSRHLLAIGYNVAERRRDESYYDLLASEARLCSYLAIAQGQVPQQGWFALGRLLVGTGGEPVLLSWSGSMFEYLMPLLVMPNYADTLIDQTYRAVVARQIEYGRQRGVPWGISESGYNSVDVNFNYQYRAFGVPGLGLKRGLAEDLVVAPYASALALMVAPEAACANLQRLAADRMVGKFGFYEAIDYTPSRLPRGQSSAVIRSYMAHHQGMSLLALAYLLLDRPMQQRFSADPLLQANKLLLQERIPKASLFHAHAGEFADIHTAAGAPSVPLRVINNPDAPLPEVQLLSNGRYHVVVSHAGGGYSRWKDYAVTRWHEDATRDHWGAFCYIRDVASGAFWSNAHQPTLKPADRYAAIFSEGRAEFRRRDHEYDTHTDIVVSPEDDIELRRIRITNRSRLCRTIEVTSYAEVVLAAAAADAMHPAFSNLFVQTEIVPQQQAILCTRRPRAFTEHTPWMFHLLTVHEGESSAVSYETDRARFIGRGNSLAAPNAMAVAGELAGGQGAVLDPMVAIRHRITLASDASVTLDLVIGMADSRAACLELVEKYHDRRLADRVFDLAWTHSQVVLRQLNVGEADAQRYVRLANSVIYAHGLLRADPGVLIRNRRGQSGLWAYAISGDLPIVLLRIKDPANIELARQLVQAHAYWRLKGLAVDLVIWNEDSAGYRQALQDQILGLIASGVDAHVLDRPGGIFVRHVDQIAEEDRILLQAVARAILSDERGELAEQLDRRVLAEVRVPGFTVSRSPWSYDGTLTPSLSQRERGNKVAATFDGTLTPAPALASLSQREREKEVAAAISTGLILYNGTGGFTPDGREYIITLAPGRTTPAPWVNVLANPHFGSVISESGQAYTWGENAHEFRLTPWHNDPVSDAGGEAFYLRDEETGQFWSPTPLPVLSPSQEPAVSGSLSPRESEARAGVGVREFNGHDQYTTRHGFGYSVFEHVAGGIRSELMVYVALDASIKFSVLKVRNESGGPRKLSATGYVEWVLGDLRPKTAMHVHSEVALASGALFARNPYNTEFPDRVAFFAADDAPRSISGDRTEFIGRNGTLHSPAAMRRAHLSGKVGAGLDPCAAIQIPFELADGQEREIVFKLGLGRDGDDAATLVQRFRGAHAARAALEGVWRYWQTSLGAVQVATPDPAVDVLVNGWLLYQTIACRLWAR